MIPNYLPLLAFNCSLAGRATANTRNDPQGPMIATGRLSKTQHYQMLWSGFSLATFSAVVGKKPAATQQLLKVHPSCLCLCMAWHVLPAP